MPLGLGPGRDASSRRRSSAFSCALHALAMRALSSRTSAIAWSLSRATAASMSVARLSSGVSEHTSSRRSTYTSLGLCGSSIAARSFLRSAAPSPKEWVCGGKVIET